jgi:hypothetical protein
MKIQILRFWFAAALLCASTACSGGADSPTGFQSQPYTTATSDSGALVIDVRTSPQPPAQGTNSVQLTITQASDGTPVDGLTLDVVPYMTAMDHGTSTPTVTPQGGGVYLVTEVYLFMPGTWALRTAISGAVTDNATPQINVP